MSNNKYAILEIAMQTGYPINMRDYIINITFEITSLYPNTKVLKVNYKNETIILLKLNVSTQFKGKNYDIPVLIYLSKGMPYEAPEVYLERTPETAVNAKNTDIDQKTNRILTKSLINWNSYFTLVAILDEIQKSFSTTFPIYKTTQSQNPSMINSNFNQPQGGGMYSSTNPYVNLNNTGVYTGFQQTQPLNGLQNTIIPGGFINTQPVRPNTIYNTIYQGTNPNTGTTTVTSSSTTFFQSNLVPQNQNPPQNLWSTFYQQPGVNNAPIPNNNPYGYNTSNVYSNNNVNPYQQPGPNNNPYGYQNPNQSNNYNNNYMGNFNVPNTQNAPALDPKKTEEEIKKILIAEIKANIENKIKEELKRNKQQEEKLKNYKNEFASQIERYIKFLNRKEEIVKSVDGISKNADGEIINLQNYIAKMQDRIMNTFNFENFIYISDVKVIKIIAIEATLEDYIAIIKKSFEKNILNFNETSKIIRNLTREALKIKLYREKLTRGY